MFGVINEVVYICESFVLNESACLLSITRSNLNKNNVARDVTELHSAILALRHTNE